MDKVEIGKIIKRRRMVIGITQKDLSKKIGLGMTAISNWETGSTVPSLEQSIKLEEILGVMTAILEKMKEDKPKPEKTRGRPKKEEKKFMTLGELRKTGFFDS